MKDQQIHIGPEPCAGAREGVGEASVGECIGQTWSRETVLIPGADAVCLSEGNIDGWVFDAVRDHGEQSPKRRWNVGNRFQ